MENQGRIFTRVNICSCFINHWATQVGAQAFTWHIKVCISSDSKTLLVIISSHLDKDQERKLLDILSEYKEAIGCTIADITGINPSVVMHQIHLAENAKISREA